jgi:hypothetical protein
VLGASLAVGVGVLGWALQAQWRGIGATSPYYSSGRETVFGYFAPGVLLAAAPAVVIAWRIGKTRPEVKTIWWSGILGVWVPVLVAVAVASVATDAGATLHWRPSLFRGFYWALQRIEQLNETALALATGTLLAPFILSLYALRELNSAWTGRRVILLVPVGLWAAAWAISQLIEPGAGARYFFSTIHVWWAWGVVALGAVAGLRVLFLPVSGKMEYHRRDSA